MAHKHHLQLLALLNTARRRRASLAKALLQPHSIERLLAPTASWYPPAQAWRQADIQVRALELMSITLIPCWAFPTWLSAPVPMPPMLFVRGDPKNLRRSGIAIVGSRHASACAERWTRDRSGEVCSTGQVVISGGARGIDAAAHGEAVRQGSKTVVYSGVAIDRCYPSGHRNLFRSVLQEGGAIVSEHAPGARTYPYDHAARNRLIAAHGHELVIAEAGLPSGTLGTANWARRFGRPIRVSAEPIGHERAGLNWLLAHQLASKLKIRPEPVTQLL